MNKPVVSILIGSIRPSLLARCLESIRRHTADVDYEVVVVSPFEIEPSSRIVHIPDKGKGYYRAIADGYEAVNGKYIIHIPDDCLAMPGWAANMIAFMKPYDSEIFEGSFRHFDVRGERPEQGHYGKLIAPFICVRKETVSRLGGLMDTSYSRFFGDPDLSLKVWQRGGRVEACPNAWIYHYDLDDEQYIKAYDRYFTQDRETFVNRWYSVFGRRGDTPLGHELRLKKWKDTGALPPEQCAGVYVSLLRRDWQTARYVIQSDENDVYPEGFIELHSLVIAMLRTHFTHKNVLYQVLEWMSRKGYIPAATTLEFERKLSLLSIVGRYSGGIFAAMVTAKLGKLFLRIVPGSIKHWLQDKSRLIKAISQANSKQRTQTGQD